MLRLPILTGRSSSCALRRHNGGLADTTYHQAGTVHVLLEWHNRFSDWSWNGAPVNTLLDYRPAPA
jgi:hypothetical protein